MKKTPNLLEMNNISKAFPGVQALDNAHLILRYGSVHALVGENGAGKSTLMKCLFGIYHPDSGEIYFEGKKISFLNPRQALMNGISMVHQELNQIPKLSVMDNIWLGRFPQKGLTIDENTMLKETVKIFDDLKINVDPTQKIESLSVSDRQMVEIAKAVSYNSKIIVMDEPTSSLTEKEVENLFRIINKLREKNCGVIYISHKMEEILKIADEVTVMRDGKWIDTKPSKELTIDKIITLMVGRELTNRFPPKNNVIGKKLLEVKKLQATYEPLMQDISFELREGEILGIAGLEGSKRTEMVETIFGIRKRKSGEIILKGKSCKNSNSRMAINNGFALVTEERRKTGIFSGLSVRANTVIANMENYCGRLGITNDKLMKKDTQWIIEKLNVKTPSQKTLIRFLSGGNQQKVIFGRWLLTNPEVLILDEPTRGIDVVTKYEIYQLILDLANMGKGIIMISSEMPELLGITDRILVMSNGRIAGIVDTHETNQQEILRLAAKYL